jgi:hypothetical protein
MSKEGNSTGRRQGQGERNRRALDARVFVRSDPAESGHA